jgi:hypothetical protein
MLEVLIFLVVATIVVLGIVSGNVFVCTFATLGVLVPAWGIALMAQDHAPWTVGAFVLTILVWGPFWHRRRKLPPIHPPVINQPTTSKHEQEWRAFGTRH